MMNAVDASGNSFAYRADIERKKRKKHKVKRLGPTQISEGDIQFIMTPFQSAWGCLDPERLREANEQVDSMGFGS